MLKENESKEVLKEQTSDLSLDDDDDFFDDDDLLDDDDDWDEDAYAQQEQSAELSQIESFLTQTVMVRCERYNANITSASCYRKKTSPAPKVKNAQAQEEEVIQNHPCFGCPGPIWVNWPIQDPPIALHEVEERPVIVHPGIEDDFSLAREKQIEAYREQYTGTRYEIDAPEEEELPSYTHVRMKERLAILAQESESTPVLEVEVKPDPEPTPVEEPKAKKPPAKVETVKKEEAITPEPPALEEPPEVEEEEPEVKAEVAPTEEKKTPKTSTKKTKSKAKAKQEEEEEPEEEPQPEKEEADSNEEHPPCADCGREYAPPASKYWRGEICNPCYAKKLRKRKKKGGTTKAKAKAKPAEATDHPPCNECGREYAPPASKYWRGEICNPCYAKKLRKRKSKKKKK
ncbi:MAG: hypothetical protein EP343_24200 [Deltaproteobacteria bacterium]|nr:MAG: hypothetical protein EP343_24200 [Deltaproteobacteria bacterium]